jgi:histidinol dehydrogenase
MEADVRKAYAEVLLKGEKAITEYTSKFDYSGFTDENIFLSDSFVNSCVDQLTSDLKAAICQANKNIFKVNKQIMNTIQPWNIIIGEGHGVGERVYPLEKVLLWVPARKGPLISTAIMLCNAAATAGVKQIIVATPPGVNGELNADTIAAAKLAGATDFVCGNALSVIACAATGNWRYGKVNAIFGPGPNAVALTMLQGARYGVVTQPGVGPSDSMIVFDEITEKEANTLARDMLTETEHGVDSCTYALTTNAKAAQALQKALEGQKNNLFGKAEQYQKIAVSGNAAIVAFKTQAELITFANRFVAEHLMVFMDRPAADVYVEALSGAAELLVGKNIPFSSANYCVGVTAVLPTNGFARSYSGITSRNFVRYATRAELTPAAFDNLCGSIEVLGKSEKLPNHAYAATVRHPSGKTHL